MFEQSATVCFGIGARPREYINAQFNSFEQFSSHMGKTIFPQPCHLKGLNAAARYLEYKTESKRQAARDDAATVTATKEYFSEKRRLKAMVRRHRQPEAEILVAHHQEFSQEFLAHCGVWPLVEDEYDA